MFINFASQQTDETVYDESSFLETRPCSSGTAAARLESLSSEEMHLNVLEDDEQVSFSNSVSIVGILD